MLPNNLAGGNNVGNTQPRALPTPDLSTGAPRAPLGNQPPTGGSSGFSPPEMGAPEPLPTGEGAAPSGVLFPDGFQAQRFGNGQEATPQEQQEIKQAAMLAKGLMQDPENLQALHQIMTSAPGDDVTSALASFATALLEKLFTDLTGQGGMSGVQWITSVLAVIASVAESVTEVGAQLEPEQVSHLSRTTIQQVKSMMLQKGWMTEQDIQVAGQSLSKAAQSLSRAGAQPPRDQGFGPSPQMSKAMPPEQAGSMPPSAPPQASQAPPKKRTRRRGSRGGSNAGYPA